jgi:hypothetical protein
MSRGVLDDLAHDFALKVQSAFPDWPAGLHAPLREWTRKNQARHPQPEHTPRPVPVWQLLTSIASMTY